MTTHAYGPFPSQVGDLLLPAGTPRGAVVVVHGGFWSSAYDRSLTARLAADLTARGWASWNLDFRLLDTNDDDGTKGGWPATFADVAAGVDHLATLGFPTAAVVGHSAGGHLALWAAHRGLLPPGAVGADPLVAVTACVGLAPVCLLDRAGDRPAALLGGTREQRPDVWAQADPGTFGSPGVPTLLCHPRGDRVVSWRYSQRYADACEGVEIVTPEGGDHMDGMDPVSPTWLAAADWLAARA